MLGNRLEIKQDLLQQLSTEFDYSNIIGYGLEIVQISCIQILREQSPEDFEMQYFTPRERNTADFSPNHLQYFAGRFAAKKAVITALNQGWNQHISWLDLEIQRLPSGAPSVMLSGQYQEIAASLGITKCLVSISHTSFYAIANAIAI